VKRSHPSPQQQRNSEQRPRRRMGETVAYET